MNPVFDVLDRLEQLDSAQQGITVLIGDADLSADHAQNVSILMMLLDELRSDALKRLREQVNRQMK